MSLRKELKVTYDERIALLRLAAQGRREYAKEAPDTWKETLESQAEALESAAQIMEGKLSPLFGLVPSWMWTEEMQKDLERRLGE